MTDYADLKVSPILRDVLVDAAKDEYGSDFRAISRAGHEAIIAWLVLRCDPAVRTRALDDHGFSSTLELIDALAEDDGADGRFAGDDQFDPLATIRTPRHLRSDDGTDTDDGTDDNTDT
jgi:hypothetical protein